MSRNFLIFLFIIAKNKFIIANPVAQSDWDFSDYLYEDPNYVDGVPTIEPGLCSLPPELNYEGTNLISEISCKQNKET